MTNFTQDEQQIQRLCIDAGFKARMREVDSDRNPFFDDGHGGGEFIWTEEDARTLHRAQAWWFGWHEADVRATTRAAWGVTSLPRV